MYARGERAFFDFSLESRLGGYFGRIGPFIAIGEPGDKSPMLGASRVQLSDDEWQDQVLKWIEASRCIVLMAGTTHWVTWELSKVVHGGHAKKLILLFPQYGRWFGRRKDADARLSAVREALAGSDWASALATEVDRPQDIRAMALGPGGTVDLITSRPRNRSSYQIAALVAHHILTNYPVVVLSVSAVARAVGIAGVR